MAEISPWSSKFAANLLALNMLPPKYTASAPFCTAAINASRLPAGENEIAVTLCNMAELYDRQDHEDMRIGQCMERAWEVLNTPGLPRDGYHAFNIAKCAPSFDYFGYFLWAKELKERAEKIYGGT